jgi:hypothetical protein
MKAEQFVFWLQGLLEIGKPETLNKEQVEIIKNHLNLVFKHEIDPSLNEGKSKEEVKELQDVHDGKKKKLSDFSPPLKKDKSVVDWLSDKFKPSHINRPKSWLDDRWRPDGNYDDNLLRC